MQEPRLVRFSPGARRTLQVVGVVCTLAGFGLFLSAMGGLMLSDQPWMDSRPSGFPVPWFMLAFVGLPLIGIGSVGLKLGFLKPVSELVATETSGAVAHSGAALGRGVGRGLRDSEFQWGGLGREVVKVRCRACGFLESEDARFCSQCAKPV